MTPQVTGSTIYDSIRGGSGGEYDVIGGLTDNHILTGLQGGEKYTISIFATFAARHSQTMTIVIRLGSY